MPAGRDSSAGDQAGGAERRAFLLRISPELMEELRTWASQEFRSLNAHLEYLLSEAARRRREGTNPAP